MSMDGLFAERPVRDVPRTALTVFAHPDDAEISCFGLLSKLRREGWRIVMVIATRGENGADVTSWDRLTEARRAAESIGAELVYGDFSDGHVQVTGDLIRWVEGLLQTWRPDIVLTHFTGESRTSHQDHVSVEAAVQIAVRRATWRPMLLLAEGIDHDITFRPNWFVDITQDYETKVGAIGMHQSQSNKYYMKREHVDVRARRWDINFPRPADSEYAPRYWEAFFLVQHVM
ncbi:hypothetical protein E2974_14265 [Paracoccus yeei]